MSPIDKVLYSCIDVICRVLAGAVTVGYLMQLYIELIIASVKVGLAAINALIRISRHVFSEGDGK